MQAIRWKILCLLGGLALGCAVASPQKPVTLASSPISVKPQVIRPFPQELIFAAVKKWTQGFSGRSGVVCGEVAQPLRVAYQAEASFESASLVKLPILVELGRRLQAGSCKLEDKLTFAERQRVGGSGVLKDRPAGGAYSVGQLAEWMITESDNVATDMLLEYLKLPSIEEQMVKLGLKHTTVQRTVFAFDEIDRGHDNRISAGDAATLLGKMARQELPRSDWMLQILQKTRRHDLIQAPLPPSLKVAHKTGELTGFLHDAAIIYTASPYVLVILTQGEKADSEKLIRGLSEEIYRATESVVASPQSKQR